MSPSAEYPADLAKRDPLTTLHIKVPSSIVPIFNREANERIRHSSFVMREVLTAAAQKLAIKHDEADKRAKLAQAAARKKAS